MPAYTTLILIAVVGALYLAMLAIARRWPGDGPWFGSGRGPTGGESKESELTRYARVLLERQVLLEALRARFGDLPAAVVARIEQADPAWCEERYARALTAGSLEELSLLDEPDAAPTASHAGHS